LGAKKTAPVNTANLINGGDAYPGRTGPHTPCSLRCSLARPTGATTDIAGPPGFQTRGTGDSTDSAFRGGVGTNGARMKVRSLFNVSDKMYLLCNFPVISSFRTPSRSSMSSADIKAFRNALRSSRRIIAVAGAGLSAASGTRSLKSRSMTLSAPQVSPRSVGQAACGESTTQ